MISSYINTINSYNNHEYKVIEGTVKNVEQIRNGEAFDINSMHLKHSNLSTLCYNRTSADGSVLVNDAYVRLSYAQGDDEDYITIWKVEVG